MQATKILTAAVTSSGVTCPLSSAFNALRMSLSLSCSYCFTHCALLIPYHTVPTLYNAVPKAQTKSNFAAIKLFETKKENEFKQTTATGSTKQLGSKQRRSLKAGGKYWVKYLANIWQITKIFGGLP